MLVVMTAFMYSLLKQNIVQTSTLDITLKCGSIFAIGYQTDGLDRQTASL